MSDRFEDARGVIQDMFDGESVAVTTITTLKDAVRGNHVHARTTQWTLVIDGRLLMASGDKLHEVGPLEMATHEPGTPHAWRALEDSECLVFTLGPRSGENYESDTERLEVPLLS